MTYFNFDESSLENAAAVLERINPYWGRSVTEGVRHMKDLASQYLTAGGYIGAGGVYMYSSRDDKDPDMIHVGAAIMPYAIQKYLEGLDAKKRRPRKAKPGA